MIAAFLISILGRIIAFFLAIGFIVYFIGFVKYMIELLKGNFPRCRGPFF